MTLDEYQQQAREFALYPTISMVTYPALGLASEAGEVAGKVKKWVRGDYLFLDPEAMQAELGDVLWYVAMLAKDCGLSLDKIAAANIAKLTARDEAGTIRGDGDNR